MSPPADNFYADWRAECRAGGVLRDENDSPPERLLQAVWQHQRLHRDALKTADGRIVRIFHPGFANAEGGPDFRGAVLQIGDDTPRAGDVEVDLRSQGWRAHGHDRNPNFQNVILHVVWSDDGTQNTSPARIGWPMTLSLRGTLDAPLGELSWWLENEPSRALPENLRGKCSAQLREMDETRLAELLNSAAQIRFQSKAAQFRARARSAGWEQALWEGLFRALGYKHNAWPMQNLAETKSSWSAGVNSAFQFQVRLLGVSGLLPAELTRAQRSPDNYLRRAWDVWWRERDGFSEFTLPCAVWKFHGLRPANHPQRRLALASHWLAGKNIVGGIENWFKAEIPDRELPSSLHEILQVDSDEFWSWHWTFRSARLKKPRPLLGGARVTDMAVNVILPWLWARAGEGKSENPRREVERRFFAWPAAEDNSVLKLARRRLLGTSHCRALRTAAAQQGLMQITRDFCERTNAVCENCRFPERLRGWKTDSWQPT